MWCDAITHEAHNLRGGHKGMGTVVGGQQSHQPMLQSAQGRVPDGEGVGVAVQPAHEARMMYVPCILLAQQYG